MKYWLFDGSDIIGPLAPQEIVKREGFSMQTLVCPETESENEKAWKEAAAYEDFSEEKLAQSAQTTENSTTEEQTVSPQAETPAENPPQADSAQAEQTENESLAIPVQSVSLSHADNDDMLVLKGTEQTEKAEQTTQEEPVAQEPPIPQTAENLTETPAEETTPADQHNEPAPEKQEEKTDEAVHEEKSPVAETEPQNLPQIPPLTNEDTDENPTPTLPILPQTEEQEEKADSVQEIEPKAEQPAPIAAEPEQTVKEPAANEPAPIETEQEQPTDTLSQASETEQAANEPEEIVQEDFPRHTTRRNHTAEKAAQEGKYPIAPRMIWWLLLAAIMMLLLLGAVWMALSSPNQEPVSAAVPKQAVAVPTEPTVAPKATTPAPKTTPVQKTTAPAAKPAATPKPAAAPRPTQLPPPPPVPASVSQTDKAIELVKNYSLSDGRGTIESYLNRLYRAQLSQGYSADWSADPLHKNSYIVKYRLTKTRTEPIVYVFQADVEKNKLTGALNNITLDLVGKI